MKVTQRHEQKSKKDDDWESNDQDQIAYQAPKVAAL
jgi:hypothetical protein